MIQRVKRYISTYKNIDWENIGGWRTVIDCVFSRLFDGAGTYDYLALEFYRKSRYERNRYLTNRRNVGVNKKWLQGVEKNDITTITNKVKFNTFFKKFIQRDFLDTSCCDREEIRAFIEKYHTVIAKPANNMQGIGIQLVSINNLNDGVTDTLKNGNYLLEQLIIQHHLLGEINPSSVNTVRIASAIDKNGKAHLVGATLRCGGKGSVVDNFHAGGVAYPIDMKVGCVCGYGKRHSSSDRCLYHPASGKYMVGFHIPNWDKALATVIEAAEMLPQMKYIGWDIAVTEQGIELIEANYGHDATVIQLDGIGKYEMVNKTLFG